MSRLIEGEARTGRSSFWLDGRIILAGILGFATGGAATGFIVANIEEASKTPIFDCTNGRGGSIELALPPGQEYSMKTIYGGSAIVEVGKNGAVDVLVNEDDGKSITLHAPATIEDESATYQVGRAKGSSGVAFTATCKAVPSETPTPSSSK